MKSESNGRAGFRRITAVVNRTAPTETKNMIEIKIFHLVNADTLRGFRVLIAINLIPMKVSHIQAVLSFIRFFYMSHKYFQEG